MHDADTIAAISSPIGAGGIGIVRMSGPDAHSILKKIFRPRKATRRYVSHRLYLGFLYERDSGMDMDEVFAVFMNQPHTYTKERVAEVFCHGGLAAVRQALTIMLKSGARMAEPGEFTKRAFLNGRIDLVQAESVLDIVGSETARELEAAVLHVKGQLSESIRAVGADIRGLLAEVEAEIDFPDEDLALGGAEWSSRLQAIRTTVTNLVSSYYEGRALKQGYDVLILGRSNVGKSSLLNALVHSQRAIVTDIPGTTRDLVEDTFHVKGVKLRVTDTAGLREDSRDPIEAEGIARARNRIPDADLVLWVLDGSMAYTTEDESVYEAIKGKRTIAVVNKADLPVTMDEREPIAKGLQSIRASALTGLGIDGLKESVYESVAATGGRTDGGLILTNVRHRDALMRTEEALHRAETACARRAPIEFIAFDLRAAMACLGEIIGESYSEELLNEIFSRFCIGK
jgi:tRNA modification GTPase